MQDQDTIEEACLGKTIPRAAEKKIPKTSSYMKKRPSVTWWNKECDGEEKIVRTIPFYGM